MSLRELIILLLGLAIVGIILRGLYVALQARRGQLRIAIDKNIPTDIDLEALELAELPGGGARVVSRESADDESPVSASLDAANQRAESFSLGVEDEAVPVLMDSVEVDQVTRIDTTASSTGHDGLRAEEGERGDGWEDERDNRWEDDEADFDNTDSATPENVPEAGRVAGERDSVGQRWESPAAAMPQDLFDDEAGEKQEPRIGDLQSYESASADTHDESANGYHAYDEYDDDGEAAPAQSHDDIGVDRPSSARSLAETDAITDTMAAEHPDDVLFDYDSEEVDENEPGEAHADDAYSDNAYEDDEETEDGSVFLSEHDHSGRVPRADSDGEPHETARAEVFPESARAGTGEESYEQDGEDSYQDVHEETYDDTYKKTYEKAHEQPNDNIDDADDYIDEYDEDDAQEIGDQSQAPEDEFAEFSMTAGERIGGNPSTEKQAGLFDQFDEPEHAALAERGKVQKKPSLFAALKRRFTATNADIEELSASGPRQPNAASAQSAELDLVDPAADLLAGSITESVAGDADEYATAPALAAEPADGIQRVSESPAVDAQSQFNEQEAAEWSEAEDSEPAMSWDSENEETAVTQADNISESSEAEATRASHDGRQIDWAGTAKPEPRQQSPVSQPSEIKQQTPAAQPAEVIVLNVVARGGREFRGDDLLEVLITSGLKFGEMNIFHQRFRGTNNGPVIFSVANILNPGTFDLNSIHEFSTVGVSLFLALPSPINNLEAFDQMLAVAQRIREELDGELKDDHRNVMTAQTIEHYRQRIRDFELRQLKAAGGRA